MKICVVADDTDRSGGYVVERLIQRGGHVQGVGRMECPAPDSTRSADLVVVLGSHLSAHDDSAAPIVEAEIALLRQSLRARIPVMAICYGAQVAARALGGTSYRADQPEVGLRRVDTADPTLCPEGPWPQFHQDVFVPASTSEVIGSTWVGPQCFVDDSLGGRLIAWQFHPEVRPETFARWASQSAQVIRRAGLDAGDVVGHVRDEAAALRNRAFALTDAALDYLGVSSPA